MKKIIFIILICIPTFLGFALPKKKKLAIHNNSQYVNNDTTYYLIRLAIEAYSKSELIKTYKVNDSLFAYVKQTEHLATGTNREKEIINIKLQSSQIDSLINFETLIKNKTIWHNQGLKLSGRNGYYYITKQNKILQLIDTNLYSLVDALGFFKK